MKAQQPSRLALGARFIFYVGVAPLLLAAVFAGVLWLLGQVGIIHVNG